MPLPALLEAKARGVSKALRASYLSEAEKPEHPAYGELNDLHYNVHSRAHIPFHPKLHKELKTAHKKASDASYLADKLARNWPGHMQKALHHKAAQHHEKAREEAGRQGFSELAKQHHAWSEYHHGKAGGPAKHPEPEHPMHPAPEPAGHHPPEPLDHPEPQHAPHPPKRKGMHWNEQHGTHERLPDEAHSARKGALSASRMANDASKGGDHESAAQLHHVATQQHMKVAQELGRHGFGQLAHKHVVHAMRHLLKHNQHRIASREAES